jgi:hypothetical protein
MARNLDSRLELLEQQAEDAENLLMPWPEWRRFKRMSVDEKGEYIDGKLRALLDEVEQRVRTEAAN